MLLQVEIGTAADFFESWELVAMDVADVDAGGNEAVVGAVHGGARSWKTDGRNGGRSDRELGLWCLVVSVRQHLQSCGWSIKQLSKHQAGDHAALV